MVTMTDNDCRRISDMTYEEKKQKLQEQMLVYAQGDMLVAFSGGVDSSLILKLAVQALRKPDIRCMVSWCTRCFIHQEK